MLSPPKNARPADALVEELHRLPVQNATALRILALLEDPEVLISDIGKLVQADPSLAARVLKLANSSFFGLRSEVSQVEQSIMVIGLSTVRTFTLAAAFDLFSDRGANLPEAFWHNAVSTAAGATAVAKRVRVSPGDAFSAGLLHDLGVALLYRHAPDRYEATCCLPGLDGEELMRVERAVFGIDHCEAGGIVLKECRFPKPLVEAIVGHHEPVRRKRLGKPDLATVVAAGEVLAKAVDRGQLDEADMAEVLEAVGIDGGASTVVALADELNTQREILAAFVRA